MNDIQIRTHIFETLYQKRVAAGSGVGAVEVAALASAIGAPALRVAMICRSLVQHAHAECESDGNPMGYVRLSDTGMAYYEEISGWNDAAS